jgi:hypothetical protein
MATLNVTVHGLRGHQAVGQQEDGPVLPLDRPPPPRGPGAGGGPPRPRAARGVAGRAAR